MRAKIQKELYNQKTNAQHLSRTWRIVSTSVKGTSHEKTGQPCQDANHWRILPDGVLIAAVADGAGSAALGEVGSEVAARTSVQATAQAIKSLCSMDSVKTENLEESVSSQIITPQLFEDDEDLQLFMLKALEASQSSLKNEAEERNVKIRDLATTLILLVATSELVSVVQIGDGTAVASDDKGNIIALTFPQNGEYINETNFLVSSSVLEMAQITVYRGCISHIAILSDGLQLLALNMLDSIPYKPFFSPLFCFIDEMTDEMKAQEELELFLRSKRVRGRTSDDLTLLLATLVEEF